MTDLQEEQREVARHLVVLDDVALALGDLGLGLVGGHLLVAQRLDGERLGHDLEGAGGKLLLLRGRGKGRAFTNNSLIELK